MITALSVQQQIAAAFAAACPELATAGVAILCEDALDIATAAANALAKVGCVGIVATPQFTPAGQGNPAAVAMDAEAALEFYETAANRQRQDAVTALSCALYAAQNCPANYGLTNVSQDSLGEGVLRARVAVAVTLNLTPETTEE